jgi:hypothetical protein
MGIPSEAAKLPSRPADDGALKAPTMPAGGDGTFEGEIETNLYGLTVADMKNKRSPNKFKNGELRDQIVWLFTVDGQEERGTIAVYSSYSLHEKSSLLPVLAALNKPTPAEGEPMSKSTYVGSKCKGFIEMKQSKTSDKSYARITKLVKA